MARIEHHSSYAFLLYFLVYLVWKGTIIPGWAVFLILFAGLFPDLDTIYWIFKKKGKMNTEFQHHLYFWTHWPISYVPLIFVFVISVLFNFYPEYFIIPVIGIYFGHLLLDSIATGDGVMWGKIPWKKKRYARYVNLFSRKTDGYHGRYWEARYRKSIFFKLGHLAAITSIIIILVFQIIYTFIDVFYIISIVYLLVSIIIGLRKVPAEFYKEPPKGRYADYRKNPDYINGLSEKNRENHLKKYSNMLNNVEA